MTECRALGDDFRVLVTTGCSLSEGRPAANPGMAAIPLAPILEMAPGASSFAVFTAVRRLLWDAHRNAALHGASLATPSGASTGAITAVTAGASHSSVTASGRPVESAQLPRVVGLGVTAVFSLIRDSAESHPPLCLRALQALLQLLEGQLPEALGQEPPEQLDELHATLETLSASTTAGQLATVACSCLLSLAVARGCTAQMLRAAASVLTRAVDARRTVQLPAILSSLQTATQRALSGSPTPPRWLSHGIVRDALVSEFALAERLGSDAAVSDVISIASDGSWLYCLCKNGLVFNVGSGYGGTVLGRLYNSASCVDDSRNGFSGQLVVIQRSLYLLQPPLLTRLDCTDLSRREQLQLPSEFVDVSSQCQQQWRWFSDGSCLCCMRPQRDDFYDIVAFRVTPAGVKQLPPHQQQGSVQLLCHSAQALGESPWSRSDRSWQLDSGKDQQRRVMAVVAGKEFMLLTTVQGRVMFCGKATSLGMKQTPCGNSSWRELTMLRAPAVTQLSVGHEGQHAVLVTEDGGAYFVGTAHRGEDGEMSVKSRRQLKPQRPKRIARMDGKVVVEAACNSGSTGLITSSGHLYLFGKEAVHCEGASGMVGQLRDVRLSHVALGKAHVVVLTSSGHVYTFGLNNKGQCGRELVGEPSTAPTAEGLGGNEVGKVSSGVAADRKEPDDEERDDASAVPLMCAPERHSFVYQVCMVCMSCGQCTGFGSACVSSASGTGNPSRVPGSVCGCGAGVAGCATCGVCRTCAENTQQQGARAAEGGVSSNRSSSMKGRPLADGGIGAVTSALALRKHRGGDAPSGRGDGAVRRRRRRSRGDRTARVQFVSADAVMVSDTAERGSSGKMASLSPARLTFGSGCDSAAVQVACGLHHTVILHADGSVHLFGSNIWGQLGMTPLGPRSAPRRMHCSDDWGGGKFVQVAAGSNHTVLLTSGGSVVTFGAYQRGQLGREVREADSRELSAAERELWFAMPGCMPGLGAEHGRRASWIAASGDHTFIGVDENRLSIEAFASAGIIANSGDFLGLLVSSKSIEQSCQTTVDEGICTCLVVTRSNGFGSETTSDVRKGQLVTFDHCYQTVWSLDTSSGVFKCYNVMACGQPAPEDQFTFGFSSPELALPSTASASVSEVQLALSLLSCIDALSRASVADSGPLETVKTASAGAARAGEARDELQMVHRFQNHGGGWGYSAHSEEALRFMCDADVLVYGFGLYGGRGRYQARIRLYDQSTDGAAAAAGGPELESDGQLLSESGELSYECVPRQTYQALLPEPVSLQAGRWYLAWARVEGPSSDCGADGQTMVVGEDQVVFYFMSSKRSNNGTDVNAGQLPQILYRLVPAESDPAAATLTPSVDQQQLPLAVSISRKFSRSVTPAGFEALIQLVDWGWRLLAECYSTDTRACSDSDLPHLEAHVRRYVHVLRCSGRLLLTYVCIAYPAEDETSGLPETRPLAAAVVNVRRTVCGLLTDGFSVLQSLPETGRPAQLIRDALDCVMDCFHDCMVGCFHAFYPTTRLKWLFLQELLVLRDTSRAGHGDLLFSAVLAALCDSSGSRRVRLCHLLPVMDVEQQRSPSEQLTPLSPHPTLSDMTRHPLLVEAVTQGNHQSIASPATMCSFLELLDQLLTVLTQPLSAVMVSLHRDMESSSSSSSTYSPSARLQRNAAALLSTLMRELVSQQGLSADDHYQLPGMEPHPLYWTPSRFARVSSSRAWTAGDGAPDALTFTVDSSAVLIAGALLYSGAEQFGYQLQLLQERSSQPSAADAPLDQRWAVLLTVGGCFAVDDAEVVEARFSRPVAIKEGVKYAMRLRVSGGRTCNGDGGQGRVRGPDGTMFTFSASPLSLNGTNLSRGQLPQILYYSTMPCVGGGGGMGGGRRTRRAAVTLLQTVCRTAVDQLTNARAIGTDAGACIVADSLLVSQLLPSLLAQMSFLVSADPKSAVQVISSVQDLLPHVAALNNLRMSMRPPVPVAANDLPDASTTVSAYRCWVESAHPYPLSTVRQRRVQFPPSVVWMSIEFDRRCCTAQLDDELLVQIPGVESDYSGGRSLLTVLKLHGARRNWSRQALVIPGRRLVFTLLTSAGRVRRDRDEYGFGFRCLVTGYDKDNADGLQRLELEITALCGLGASSLMRRDLPLKSGVALSPDSEEPPVAADGCDESCCAEQSLKVHASLLTGGLALSQQPTVLQALDDVLPLGSHGRERQFLRELVSARPGSSGARLAAWLQPESYIVPSHTRLVCLQPEGVRRGWPVSLRVSTHDQHQRLAHASALNVQLSAEPLGRGSDHQGPSAGCKVRRLGHADRRSFGGHPVPSLNTPYESTLKDKTSYQAITLMPDYSGYSFEELRFATPSARRPAENMLVRSNGDGTYTALWTPSSAGSYSITISLDGVRLETAHRLEAQEPPAGFVPPSPLTASQSPAARQRLDTIRKERRVCVQNSAGLRIRSHASLQAEQVGVVPIEGHVCVSNELHNVDGLWVRLTSASLRQYSTMQPTPAEGWCLQFNQHLSRPLLTQLELSPDDEMNLSHGTVCNGTGFTTATQYEVVHCGVNGHNIRSKPCRNSGSLSTVNRGCMLHGTEVVENGTDSWLKLAKDSCSRFCPQISEAWSLIGDGKVIYLSKSAEARNPDQVPSFASSVVENKFSTDLNVDFRFGSGGGEHGDIPCASGKSSPFVFKAFKTGDDSGSDTSLAQKYQLPLVSHAERSSRAPSVLERWLNRDTSPRLPTPPRGVTPPPPRGVTPPPLHPTVRQSEPSAAESRHNGNGETPPGTPKRRLSSSSLGRKPSLSPKPSPPPRRSSPLPVPGSSDRHAIKAPTLTGLSASSGQSNCSIVGSPLLRESVCLSLGKPLNSTAVSTNIEHVATEGMNSLQVSHQSKIMDPEAYASCSEIVPPQAPVSAGLTNWSPMDEMHHSPKMPRRERHLSRSKRERTQSPSTNIMTRERMKSKPHGCPDLSVRQEVPQVALTPSVAECYRAVFSALLWHEGLVHDAITCASFLKFNYDKSSSDISEMINEDSEQPCASRLQRAQSSRMQPQRHSLEVTTGKHFHSSSNQRPMNTHDGNPDNVAEDGESSSSCGYPTSLRYLASLWARLHDMIARILSTPVENMPLNLSRDRHLDKRRKEKQREGFEDALDFLSGDVEEQRRCRLCRALVNDLPGHFREQHREVVWCELCDSVIGDGVVQPSLLDHMKLDHAGCQQSSDGWAFHASSGQYTRTLIRPDQCGTVWTDAYYFLCSECRDKALLVSLSPSNCDVKRSGNGGYIRQPILPSEESPCLSLELYNGASGSGSGHLALLQNALFLLEIAAPGDLTPAATAACPRLSSPPPFTSAVPLQCLHALGGQQLHLQRVREQELSAELRLQGECEQLPVDSASVRRRQRSSTRPVSACVPDTDRSGSNGSVRTRRRAPSCAEVEVTAGSTTLLARPSVRLQQLETALSSPEQLLCRPAVAFLLQQHNISALRFAMRQAMRQAACRVYALQAFNWLMRSVSQPTSLHDLVWHLVQALTPDSSSNGCEATTDEDESSGVLEHPLTNVALSGSALLPVAFHALLQTVSDLMPLLPSGSPLQLMAVRCWGLRFQADDHGFLHRCHVFSNISSILAAGASEETECANAAALATSLSSSQCMAAIGDKHVAGMELVTLEDITNSAVLSCSSRPALIESLTDASTETFWESADEDRNRTKWIAAAVDDIDHFGCLRLVAVYIDNVQDHQAQVTSMCIRVGRAEDELWRLAALSLDIRHTGWLPVPVPLPLTADKAPAHVRIELKGPENSVRVRQVLLLGGRATPRLLSATSATRIGHAACEAETLRVFRLICVRVFGRLLAHDEGETPSTAGTPRPPPQATDDTGEEHTDLRQHMVSILFSRSRLTHLQTQVCGHIMAALSRESTRLRCEDQQQQQVPDATPDVNCFEMLSLLLALSGSVVGRQHLAQQRPLLMDLLTLLHRASARCQRQVISLLRRVLPELTPEAFASLQGPQCRLPVPQYSPLETETEVGDRSTPFGVLDVLFACVAKCLSVQLKYKQPDGQKILRWYRLAECVTSVDMWWMHGPMTESVSTRVLRLLQDMSDGKLSDVWQQIARAAITECLLELSRLPEPSRSPDACARTPTLWLALVALCALDAEYVNLLDSADGNRQMKPGDETSERAFCENHDDGATLAIISCDNCGSLCAECERILHLPRRARTHIRQLLKQTERAMRVDKHEGCGRLKLFWMMALSDAPSLMSMVELGTRATVAVTTASCRFCGGPAAVAGVELGDLPHVCAEPECAEYATAACQHTLDCGHPCAGLLDEVNCLPCLRGCSGAEKLRQDADDMCMVCFSEPLRAAPVLQLTCGHLFHAHCCRRALTARWPTARITFGFSLCAICKTPMEHPALDDLLAPVRRLMEDVRRKALIRAEYEGVPLPSDEDRRATLAMQRYAYYVCSRCERAYYGGEARCQVALDEGADQYDPTELVCGGCSDVALAQLCPKHGTDFLEYKCRYCCSVAVFFCFGRTHFCSGCHDDFQRLTGLPEHQLPSCPAGPRAVQLPGDQCPLRVQHPSTGQEFALGCGVCRNAHTF